MWTLNMIAPEIDCVIYITAKSNLEFKSAH